jgi:hypothetical protein
VVAGDRFKDHPESSCSLSFAQGIRPPEEIISCIKGGIGSAGKRSPSTSISPLSVSIRISESGFAADAAPAWTMTGRPRLALEDQNVSESPPYVDGYVVRQLLLLPFPYFEA